LAESDFQYYYRLMEDPSPQPADHPSPDQWLAYQRGELSADEEERLQEHLARCRDCCDLAAGAAEFVQPEEEPAADQEMETAALWRLLRPQLAPPADPLPAKVREISAAPRRRPSRRFSLPTFLAASFFVALVALGSWSLHQQSLLEALRTPRPNVPIFDFAAGERLPDAAEETLRASTGPWMLVFHPTDDFPLYRLSLRDAATGRDLGSYELRPDKDFALTLHLPEGLRPGRYRLELSDGTGGGGGKVLETYRLRVTE
jgi:hypothetical protein